MVPSLTIDGIAIRHKGGLNIDEATFQETGIGSTFIILFGTDYYPDNFRLSILLSSGNGFGRQLQWTARTWRERSKRWERNILPNADVWFHIRRGRSFKAIYTHQVRNRTLSFPGIFGGFQTDRLPALSI